MRRPNRASFTHHFLLPLQTESVCRPTDGAPKPLQTNPCRGFLKDKTFPPLQGLIYWLPECRRNAPDNLLLSAERLRYLRVCPCECRPAPQKKVVGRSMCYPSTKRCAWITHRRRHSGYLLFLSSSLFPRRRAGLHSHPKVMEPLRGHDKSAPALPDPFSPLTRPGT